MSHVEMGWLQGRGSHTPRWDSAAWESWPGSLPAGAGPDLPFSRLASARAFCGAEGTGLAPPSTLSASLSPRSRGPPSATAATPHLFPHPARLGVPDLAVFGHTSWLGACCPRSVELPPSSCEPVGSFCFSLMPCPLLSLEWSLCLQCCGHPGCAGRWW